jgi:hypothetical protein
MRFAFSPDQMLLAAACNDHTALVWNTDEFLRPARYKPLTLSDEDLLPAWNDLARADASQAIRFYLAQLHGPPYHHSSEPEIGQDCDRSGHVMAIIAGTGGTTMFPEFLTTFMAVAGIIGGILARQLAATGKASLAFSLVPVTGTYLSQAFC